MIAEGKLVIDASVAVKWYIPEAGSVEASRLLELDSQLLAPDFMVAEFGNVLWKKVRVRELNSGEAEEIIGAFISSNPLDLRPATLFLESAFDIACRWRTTVYDALYLAVALAEDCPLVSADRRLSQQLQGSAMQRQVLLLADLPQ